MCRQQSGKMDVCAYRLALWLLMVPCAGSHRLNKTCLSRMTIEFIQMQIFSGQKCSVLYPQILLFSMPDGGGGGRLGGERGIDMREGLGRGFAKQQVQTFLAYITSAYWMVFLRLLRRESFWCILLKAFACMTPQKFHWDLILPWQWNDDTQAGFVAGWGFFDLAFYADEVTLVFSSGLSSITYVWSLESCTFYFFFVCLNKIKLNELLTGNI